LNSWSSARWKSPHSLMEFISKQFLNLKNFVRLSKPRKTGWKTPSFQKILNKIESKIKNKRRTNSKLWRKPQKNNPRWHKIKSFLLYRVICPSKLMLNRDHNIPQIINRCFLQVNLWMMRPPVKMRFNKKSAKPLNH
jgi:hypothetical protein